MAAKSVTADSANGAVAENHNTGTFRVLSVRTSADVPKPIWKRIQEHFGSDKLRYFGEIPNTRGTVGVSGPPLPVEELHPEALHVLQQCENEGMAVV